LELAVSTAEPPDDVFCAYQREGALGSARKLVLGALALAAVPHLAAMKHRQLVRTLARG
jgi:hypothetical protein